MNATYPLTERLQSQLFRTMQAHIRLISRRAQHVKGFYWNDMQLIQLELRAAATSGHYYGLRSLNESLKEVY